MRKRIIFSLVILFVLFLSTGRALAQNYYYQITQEVVNVFWNEDGSESLDYLFTFKNEPSGHTIDFVDLGMPNPNFDEKSIFADVDGKTITDISKSGFQGTGPGVAVGLGAYSIPPGQSGRLHVYIGTVDRVLYPDTEDSNYVSADFAPAYFDSSNINGTTDMTVIFHLPPGVTTDEPRWHTAPSGWPSQPETGFDDKGQITYTWHNPQADVSLVNNLGASFPKKYVPDSAIVRTNILETIGKWIAASSGVLITLGCVSFFIAIIAWSVYSSQRRKLQYLPPKVSIEGHGIKRGLTAVEAAILMEEPMEKIMTMMLFGTIKKNAARVVSRDPLELEITDPLPAELQPYEKDFLAAFKVKGAERRKALETTMVNLVKVISEKMKGFSRRETIAYYRDIMKRAWGDVEAADTPEVKSQKYDEVMEWTMLDRDFEPRTRDIFSRGPVFVPIWWGRFDPGFGRSAAPTVSGGPRPMAVPTSAGAPSLPHLPGSDFAASIANSVQTMSSKVIGNVSEFTGRITQQTNPIPKPPPSSGGSGGGGRSGGSSGGGHSSCACACACAGCACACAGGSR
jgi:uncharacterized membrane protein YgcG